MHRCIVQNGAHCDASHFLYHRPLLDDSFLGVSGASLEPRELDSSKGSIQWIQSFWMSLTQPPLSPSFADSCFPGSRNVIIGVDVPFFSVSLSFASCLLGLSRKIAEVSPSFVEVFGGQLAGPFDRKKTVLLT